MDYIQTGANLTHLPKLIKQPYQVYRNFSNSIWTKGVLSAREKEIIAVAVAHSTKCAYCIRFHTDKAKQLQIPIEELAEAVMVTAVIEAGNSLFHFEGEQQFNLNKYPDHAETTQTFVESFLNPGRLPLRLKLLIAFAVTHAIQSTNFQAILVSKLDDFNLSQAEIAEAVLVTAALKAGGAVSHMAEMIDQYSNE